MAKQLPVLEDSDYYRILRGLKYREKRLSNGIKKFGDNFDPEKGKSMTEGLERYTNLIEQLEKETTDV